MLQEEAVSPSEKRTAQVIEERALRENNQQLQSLIGLGFRHTESYEKSCSSLQTPIILIFNQHYDSVPEGTQFLVQIVPLRRISGYNQI